MAHTHDVLYMCAFFEFLLSTSRMLMKPCLFALLKLRDELVFDSECFVTRGINDWRVDCSDRLRQLQLVPELIVHIYR